MASRERGWGQMNEDGEGFIWTRTGKEIVVLNHRLMVRDRRNYFHLGLARNLGEMDVEDGSAKWVPWSVGEKKKTVRWGGWQVG